MIYLFYRFIVYSTSFVLMDSKGSRKTNSTFVDVTQNYTLDCIKLDNMRRYPNIYSGGLIISMSTLRKHFYSLSLNQRLSFDQVNNCIAQKDNTINCCTQGKLPRVLFMWTIILSQAPIGSSKYPCTALKA